MYKKILVINLGGIGDVLLSTPALRALKNHFKQSDISMLVVPRVTEVVKDLPYISEINTFGLGTGDVLRNMATLILLRRKNFDLAVNMRTLVSSRSAQKMRLLLNVIRPKATAGRDTDGRGYFFDFRFPETLVADKFAMEYDVGTVRALGVSVVDRMIDFTISPQDHESVKRILAQKGISETDMLIGIHPGGQPSRRWPVENFSAAMRKIASAIPCKFIITGNKEERILSRLLIRENPNAVDCVDSFTLKELGAAISRCRIFISNDTGSIHVAAVIQTPLVAIFGPGDITRYDPRHISASAVVLYKKPPCGPCQKRYCDDLRCLTAIAVDEVTQAALAILAR